MSRLLSSLLSLALLLSSVVPVSGMRQAAVKALPAATGGGTSTQYQYGYDYRTRRISTTRTGGSQPDTATTIAFAGGLSLAEWDTDGSGTAFEPLAPTVEYTRGPDMGGGVGGLLYSARLETTGSQPAALSLIHKYNLSNGRGDVVAQSDSSGALTWTASYEAYGKRTKETGENKDKQRANSKDEDPTGLLNEGFRYRDIETGVWLSRDPAGFVDGPNLYAYVKQNPWSKFDPLGLEEFPAGVVNVMNGVGSHLLLPTSDRLSRLAAINMVGEENLAVQTRGVLSVVDKLQDSSARIGLSGLDPRNVGNPGGNKIEHTIPESWKRGNGLQKMITQLDPMLHDIGPANINLKTACDEYGVTKTDGINSVARMMVTHEGTAGYLSRAVPSAVKDLQPLISAKEIMEQAQIVTDYLRNGSDHFWHRVQEARGMSAEQLNNWKSDPENFKMPDGKQPAQLRPAQMDKDHHRQVQEVESKTRKEERPKS